MKKLFTIILILAVKLSISQNNYQLDCLTGNEVSLNVYYGINQTPYQCQTWYDTTRTVLLTDTLEIKNLSSNFTSVTPTKVLSFISDKYIGISTVTSLFPTQTGNSGKFLTTNGTAVSWGTALTSEVDGSTTNEIELPSQTSNAGRTLITNGSSVSWGKRQETYSGTTNASGNYTVTFGTAYSSAPNIQASITSGSVNQFLQITNISTTGFTVNVYSFNVVLGVVQSSSSNVSGATIDVLITEK